VNNELLFHEAMLDIYEKAKEKYGYNSTRFYQTVIKRSGLQAAKHWLSSDTPQEGLFKLWELGGLEISMERLVLRKQFRELFSNIELNRAQKRLEDFNYTVDEDS
jgi:hypothetical protein